MKNMKMKTKLILGYAIPILLTLINMYLGNKTTHVAAKIVELEEQENYMRNSTIFTVAIAAVSIIITVWVAAALIRTIEKSVQQLSDAAKEIAMGHVDINLIKYNNDEFGVLVDEYTKVIENIKYQAGKPERRGVPPGHG